MDRTQPILPLRPGVPERRTHDDVRHGVTSLFAALNAATGLVTTSLHRRHRAVEFRRFLVTIDKVVPAELDVHLVIDNASTTRPRRASGGCWLIPASMCTSRRPTAPG